jgi:hypothetical protein
MKVVILMLIMCLASTVDASNNNRHGKTGKARKVRNLLKKRFDLDDTIIIPVYWDYDFSKLAGDSNDVYQIDDYPYSAVVPNHTQSRA